MRKSPPRSFGSHRLLVQNRERGANELELLVNGLVEPQRVVGIRG